MKAIILNDKVIHIGEWDYNISEDEDGKEIINNPLPSDAKEGDFDIVKTANGSYVLNTNYAELRKAEYPPVEMYLDAIVKGDTEAEEEYKRKCLEVKAKYPKV